MSHNQASLPLTIPSMQLPSDTQNLEDMVNNRIWDFIPSTNTVFGFEPARANVTTEAGASALKSAAEAHCEGFVERVSQNGDEHVLRVFRESRAYNSVHPMEVAGSIEDSAASEPKKSFSRVSMISEVPQHLTEWAKITSYTTNWVFDGQKCEGGESVVTEYKDPDFPSELLLVPRRG